MPRKIVIIVVVAVTVVAGYYLVAWYEVNRAFAHDSIPNNLKFDKHVWQTGTIRQRGQMVDYLLDSIGITGKTKKEIRKITGNPDSETKIKDGEYTSKFYYTVHLGHPYTYEMIVFFDSTNRARDILFDD